GGAWGASGGWGGLGTGTFTNWLRHMGWGMASRGGFTRGVMGGRAVPLSRVGNVFVVNRENLRRFAEWMRYARFEQTWVFGAGCFLGMALPAVLTLTFVPAGADITGDNWQTATYQAQGLGRVFGPAALTLTLINGFWILFSTQLGNTDIFARTVTDMLWSTHPGIQRWAGGDVRRVYYSVLLAFTGFGMWAIFQSSPGGLILLGASIAVFNFVVLGTHVLVVHYRFLPPELRMPRWRAGAIGLFILMFAAFLVLGLWSQRDSIRSASGL
ncbi:MAG: Nramp family divalent metal transporter, partial [Chloroherpetonaceae bacterium]|nr:Nramp family divalent metal transporter [Chthonomonadaceae bacterium]MDW8207911.1 Nramp family divalent metal transporter [Chloroherpetonaceae bacterium]